MLYAPAPTDLLGGTSVSLSKDKRMVAVGVQRNENCGAVLVARDGKPEQVAEGYDPLLSADGSRVVYVRAKDPGEPCRNNGTDWKGSGPAVAVRDLTTGEEQELAFARPLPADINGVFLGALSADDTQLVYSLGREDGSSWFVVDLSTASSLDDAVALDSLEPDASWDVMEFLPSGELLVARYCCATPGDPVGAELADRSLVAVSLDGPRRVLARLSDYVLSAHLNEDGETLLVVTLDGQVRTGTVPADGSTTLSVRQLPAKGSGARSADW